MFTPPLRKSRSWPQAVFIMALAWVGIAVLFGRLGWEDWGTPHWIEGDPLEVYARVKIAAEQPWHALARFTHIERLGAPVSADWAAYPVPDRLVFVLTGLLSHCTGLIAAVHLMAAFITGLNAVSFYLCARWLRWRWEWAAALALVFAFCSYNVRWGITLSLNQTFLLPPLVLLCARAARRAPWVGDIRRWLILGGGLGVWSGFANPYLAFFSGVVAGGALVLALARRASRRRLSLLACFLGCLLAAFVAANAGYMGQLWHGSTGEALVRSADDLRVYALRLADWVVPPADHRLDFLASLGRAYQTHRIAGEFFYNYLGLAGFAGVCVLLWQGGRGLSRRRWTVADPLLGIGWICLFGLAGGINTWLGAAGLDLFRAGTRIGIYALVWALLGLGRPLYRLTTHTPRAASLALASFCVLIAIWEQTPALGNRAGLEHNRLEWQKMSGVADVLEKELSAQAMVFQLPAVPFPEAGPIGAMTDYQHFLPFLTSHSLRFSYGQLRSSPWLRWARYVGRLPARTMVTTLESAGFAALWIDRRAYSDSADSLVSDLRALGVKEIRDSGLPDTIRLFRLNPATEPLPPDLDDPRLHEPWHPTDRSSRLLALSGWYPLEAQGANHWRWAARRAESGYWHEGPAGTGTLRFQLGGRPTSVVVLRDARHAIWRGSPGPDPVELALPLASGLNSWVWELEGATFSPGGHDPRELGFMVENLTLSVP